MKRILFTGGGTGGHIYPILAVAEELKSISIQRGVEIDLCYLGSPELYSDILQKNNIKVFKILSSKLRRYFDLKNIIDIPKFFLSFFQAFGKVFSLMPDIVFSKGGPGSLPIVLVSRIFRVPVFIHESDTVPGLANRIASRFSKKIFISWQKSAEYFKKKEVFLVGNPVRLGLIDGVNQDKKIAKTNLGFNGEKPLIFVLGGSQGAMAINEFILDAVLDLIKNFQIIHQTGEKNYEEINSELFDISKSWPEEQKNSYKLSGYFENIKDVLSAADIIVARAGSGTIFEIAAFGKPSVLIPLPESAGDHQLVNAYEYSQTGAAIVIEQDNLKPNIFLTQLNKIINDQNLINKMSEAAKGFAKPDAGRKIAEEIIGLIAK